MDRLLTGKLIVLAAFLAVLLTAACQQAPPPSPTKATIGEIRAAPTVYQGKVVTIEGKYQGWKGGYGSPPVTRSDWLVEDATGWLYVTGKPAGLDPLGDVGHPIKVTGKVELTQRRRAISICSGDRDKGNKSQRLAPASDKFKGEAAC